MRENWEIHWKDYYQILQVHPSAEPEVIKAAYDRLARKYHPDVNQTSTASQKMKDLNEAFEILGNPEKKARYDSVYQSHTKTDGESDEKHSPAPKPKPEVSPQVIRFHDVRPGEAKTETFIIKNSGGPCSKVFLSNPSYWIKIVRQIQLSSTNKLPMSVEIEVTGEDWGKNYTDNIVIKLDDVETHIRVELQTIPKFVPKRRHVFPAWIYFAGLFVIILLSILLWQGMKLTGGGVKTSQGLPVSPPSTTVGSTETNMPSTETATITQIPSSVASAPRVTSVPTTIPAKTVITITPLPTSATSIPSSAPKPTSTVPATTSSPVKTPMNQVVIIPDANLQIAIRQTINKPTGDIFNSDLQIMTLLNARSRNIASLVGLEYCSNLSYLMLDGNQITDISPIASLTQLTQVYLSDNRITTLPKLVVSNKLTMLLLGGNQISDMTPLSSMANLTRLELSINPIKNISPLSSLTKLTQLDLDNTQISDISALSSLANLSSLYLYDNTISDISPLLANSGLSNGDTIDIRNNPLNDTSISTCIPQLQTRGVNVVFTLPPVPSGIILQDGLTTGDDGDSTTWGTTQIRGQYWTPVTAYKISAIEIYMRRVGQPGNAVLVIKSCDGTQLIGQELTRVSVSPAKVSQNNSWVRFEVPDVSLEPSKSYWWGVFAEYGSIPANYYAIRYDEHNGYPKGTMWNFSKGVSQPYAQFDDLFKIYGQ
jgi:Leucine-rich repeat (LRR) protein